MSDSNPTTESIFWSAMAAESLEAREKYLNVACGSNVALRAQIEKLIAAYPKVERFLESSPADLGVTVDRPATERSGSMIGPYKLLQEIGEGGMGAVWLAEQTLPVQRKVALKIIKPGMDTPQVIARFEAERQALALMDHPHIARVFDAGATTNGRPYFVMELVKGVPITRYCDEHRLTPRQRLELFLPVCAAIQHAHQKGIIHRDIKPSNVLVAPFDGKPIVKVIDFGVAKAAGKRLTEKTLFTEIGAVVGTLEYMSPEQAELNNQDIDTRSDIYSLGVLLYELLAGSPPFTKKDLENAGVLEMLRVIREQEPSKPSTKLSSSDALPSLSANRGTEPSRLAKLVRGELDWIVMKAMEKDRNRRYETANGFAMDIQRYLADEPVHACPPSAGYRLKKFARRNKTALTLWGVVAIAVVLVVGSIGWMARDQAAQKEEGARKVAERHIVIEQALSRSSELLKEGKWQQSLVEARRAEAALAGGSADDHLRNKVAQRLKELRMVGDVEESRHFANWDAERQDAITYSTLFRDYGIDVDALPVEEAAALIRDCPIRDYLVAALDYWAIHAKSHWMQRGKTVADATRMGDQLRGIARAADPDELRGRIRNVRTEEEGVGLLKQMDAKRVDELSPATALLLSGVLPRDQSLMILRQTQARHPDNLELTAELASKLSGDPKTYADSIRYHQAAVALRPHSLGLLANLAGVLENAGRKDEVLFIHQQAAALHPQNPHAQYNLAVALIYARRWPEAVDTLKEALRLKPDWAPAYYNLAVANERQKLWAPAIAALQDYVRLEPNDFVGQADLAIACELNGQREESLRHAQRAAILKSTKPEQSNRLAWWLVTHPEHKRCDPKWAVKLAENATRMASANGDFWNTLALAYYRDRRYPDADAALKKAMSLRKGGDAFDWFLRAMLHQQSGQTRDAESWYDRAVQWMETNAAKVDADLRRLHVEARELLPALSEGIIRAREALALDPQNPEAHFKLGLALDRQGDYTEALAAYREAIKINPKMPGVYYNIGRLLRLRGAVAEAIEANRQAVLQKPDYAAARQSLAGLLVLQGRELEDKQAWPQAIAGYREALSLKTPNDGFAHYRLAHVLATCPDPRYRDSAEAVKFAELALEDNRNDGANWLTLGIARYRAGQWAKSIEAIHKARDLHKERVDGVVFFVLAAAHWQKGERDEARQWYDIGIHWLRDYQSDLKMNPTGARVIIGMRAEVDDLLGTKKQED